MSSISPYSLASANHSIWEVYSAPNNKNIEDHRREEMEILRQESLRDKCAKTKINSVVESAVINEETSFLVKVKVGYIIQTKEDRDFGTDNGLVIDHRRGTIQFDGNLQHIKMLARYLVPIDLKGRKTFDVEGDKIVIVKTNTGIVIQSEQDFIDSKRTGMFIGDDGEVQIEDNQSYVNICLKALTKCIGLGPRPIYEIPPGPDVAKPLLVSMSESFERTKYYLENFPKYGDLDSDNRSQKGCSCTLLWSGCQGNNVPVKFFGDRKVGFVLNPAYVDVPYADCFSYKTGSVIPEEELKQGVKTGDAEMGCVEVEDSKYPNKMGRVAVVAGCWKFVTNHAKWEHLDEEYGKAGVYHEKGSIEIFARNVWRKFHKRGLVKNEALTIQKGPNPIDGLFIDVSDSKEIPQKNREDMANCLEERPDLRLYIFDRGQIEHIVRVVKGNKAIELLKKDTIPFTVVRNLPPFVGFDNLNTAI